MHFRAILLPLVDLEGRYSFGILKQPLLRSQSQVILWKMIVQMLPMVLEMHNQLQVYALSALATAFLCTQLRHMDMFQSLPKAIRNRFMHWQWTTVDHFLSLVEQRRYSLKLILGYVFSGHTQTCLSITRSGLNIITFIF